MWAVTKPTSRQKLPRTSCYLYPCCILTKVCHRCFSESQGNCPKTPAHDHICPISAQHMASSSCCQRWRFLSEICFSCNLLHPETHCSCKYTQTLNMIGWLKLQEICKKNILPWSWTIAGFRFWWFYLKNKIVKHSFNNLLFSSASKLEKIGNYRIISLFLNITILAHKPLAFFLFPHQDEYAQERKSKHF